MQIDTVNLEIIFIHKEYWNDEKMALFSELKMQGQSEHLIQILEDAGISYTKFSDMIG